MYKILISAFCLLVGYAAEAGRGLDALTSDLRNFEEDRRKEVVQVAKKTHDEWLKMRAGEPYEMVECLNMWDISTGKKDPTPQFDVLNPLGNGVLSVTQKGEDAFCLTRHTGFDCLMTFVDTKTNKPLPLEHAELLLGAPSLLAMRRREAVDKEWVSVGALRVPARDEGYFKNVLQKMPMSSYEEVFDFDSRFQSRFGIHISPLGVNILTSEGVQKTVGEIFRKKIIENYFENLDKVLGGNPSKKIVWNPKTIPGMRPAPDSIFSVPVCSDQMYCFDDGRLVLDTLYGQLSLCNLPLVSLFKPERDEDESEEVDEGLIESSFSDSCFKFNPNVLGNPVLIEQLTGTSRSGDPADILEEKGPLDFFARLAFLGLNTRTPPINFHEDNVDDCTQKLFQALDGANPVPGLMQKISDMSQAISFASKNRKDVTEAKKALEAYKAYTQSIIDNNIRIGSKGIRTGRRSCDALYMAQSEFFGEWIPAGKAYLARIQKRNAEALKKQKAEAKRFFEEEEEEEWEEA